MAGNRPSGFHEKNAEVLPSAFRILLLISNQLFAGQLLFQFSDYGIGSIDHFA